jgi:hypothetical protein
LLRVQGPPPAGPKPQGIAGLPPPGGTADIGVLVTLVRMLFSGGVPEGSVEAGTLVSAGFSWRGLQATVTDPIPTIANRLNRRADFRSF